MQTRREIRPVYLEWNVANVAADPGERIVAYIDRGPDPEYVGCSIVGQIIDGNGNWGYNLATVANFKLVIKFSYGFSYALEQDKITTNITLELKSISSTRVALVANCPNYHTQMRIVMRYTLGSAVVTLGSTTTVDSSVTMLQSQPEYNNDISGKLKISGTGKFLAGTSTPETPVEIKQSYDISNGALKEVPALNVATDNGANTWTVGRISGYVDAGVGNSSAGYPGGLMFKTKYADGNPNSLPTAKMVLDAQGYLGIGILAPAYPLEVYGGDIKASGHDRNTGVTIGSDASERPRVGFHVSDNSRRFKMEINELNSTKERLGFFSSNGGAWPETEVMSLNKTGRLGLSTNDPKANFDMGKYLSPGECSMITARLAEGSNIGNGTFLGIRGYDTQVSTSNPDPSNVKSFALEHNFYGYTNSSINFFRGGDMTGGFIGFNTNNNTEQMRLTAAGDLGIGTTFSNGYKLAVNGTIHAKETVVDLIGWPDYVFAPKYYLRPLHEVKDYIRKNQRLPEMPSAAEIEKSGLKLGEINRLLTQKVEELTLYLLKKDKQLADQAKLIKQQQKIDEAMAEQLKELTLKVNHLIKTAGPQK